MGESTVIMKGITPILRIFDEDKAKEFYLDYLGFTLEWEHRFEEDMPLYMEISYGSCLFHLSEHHGDSCPGTAIRINVENVKHYHTILRSENYKYARPELESTPWETLELSVKDPFGNHLIFYEHI
jgi:uncharacterized glyoxalase superfamily protein PhnB